MPGNLWEHCRLCGKPNPRGGIPSGFDALSFNDKIDLLQRQNPALLGKIQKHVASRLTQHPDKPRRLCSSCRTACQKALKADEEASVAAAVTGGSAGGATKHRRSAGPAAWRTARALPRPGLTTPGCGRPAAGSPRSQSAWSCGRCTSTGRGVQLPQLLVTARRQAEEEQAVAVWQQYGRP